MHRIYLEHGKIPRPRLPVDRRTVAKVATWRQVKQQDTFADLKGIQQDGSDWGDAHNYEKTAQALAPKAAEHESSSTPEDTKTVMKSAASSLFFNHSWKDLFSSEKHAPEKELRLPKHQRCLVMLCDVLYAMCLQAIFYGKNQFGIDQKAFMVLTSAAFMIPALLLYPRIFRWANCPPDTTLKSLAETRKQNRKEGKALAKRDANLSPRDYEDAEAASFGSSSRSASPVRNHKMPRTVVVQGRPRNDEWGNREAHFTTDQEQGKGREELDVQDTELWSELWFMKTLLAPYAFNLLVVTVLLIGHLLERYFLSSKKTAGLAANFATSFAASCSVLAALVLQWVLSRGGINKDLRFVRFWLCLFASGLAFSGIFLVGEEGGVMTTFVTIGTGILHLGCLYGVRIIIQLQRACNALMGDFAVVRWSHPAPYHHEAAICIQKCWRVCRARARVLRARELNAWEKDCRTERRLLTALAYTCLVLNTILMLYCNLIFGIKFDRATATGWLLTCALAMIIEGLVQQPVVLLIVSIMGDFVEVLGVLILELVAG
ncbi:unnamed protein product [Chrysoparadoxa australica]